MADFKGYEIIGGFNCGDKCMVIIKAAHGIHVMTSDEWEWLKRSLGWEQTPTEMHCFSKENSNVA